MILIREIGMRLTREQISNLSDTELNRAMIWCYPDSKYYNGYYDEYMDYDYVTDYNLTMPLAIEHQVWLQPDCMGDGFIHAYDDNFSAKSKAPLRAICEVLVMIAMEAE
jgi:hypothetical protein